MTGGGWVLYCSGTDPGTRLVRLEAEGRPVAPPITLPSPIAEPWYVGALLTAVDTQRAWMARGLHPGASLTTASAVGRLLGDIVHLDLVFSDGFDGRD